MRIAYKFTFHYHTLSAYKNLSPQQCSVFAQLVFGTPQLDQKQFNLIAQLVQKLKPSLDPFKATLTTMIQTKEILTNQDLDYAIKIIQQQIKQGNDSRMSIICLSEQYPLHIESLRIQQDLHKLWNQCNCDSELIILKIGKAHPSIQNKLIREIVMNHFLKQKQCHQTQEIYQKIQTFKPREIPDQFNSQDNIKKHLQHTQGRIILRFPPEPNGCLHLGHVRSIRLNFFSAEQLKGSCYLRYDDTNPVAEKQQYIDEIQQNVKWFGHTPTNITYASDYFDILYDSAITLIKNNKAYVCEQNKDQIQESRRLKQSSPYRERSVEQNLLLFQNMQEGLYPEHQYTLRLKIDPQNQNPTLRDPIIYRVLYHPHPRSGSKWKVYPMYDFAHCICDSIENVTHSLCTLEFEIRRELYYWILTQLDLYKPLVYEFSRLNVSNNLLSKRKINKLIQIGKVSGWDDPRLLTLGGLKRRGYTPTAINTFIDLVSLPRSGNEHIISIKQLENCIRKELDKKVIKLMVVIDPVRLHITNQFQESSIEIPIQGKQQGTRKIHLSHDLFIERKDVRLNDDSDYYGIAPNKEVCLKYFGLIKCTKIHHQDGVINLIEAELISTDIEIRKQVKGQLHWISEKDSCPRIINQYSDLFSVENPGELDDYLDYLNKDSAKQFVSMVPKEWVFQEGERYQFERMGYYYLEGNQFNKIVGLIQ